MAGYYITWKKIGKQYYAYLEYGYKQNGKHRTRSIYLGRDLESAKHKFVHELRRTGQFPMDIYTYNRFLKELENKMPENARKKTTKSEEHIIDTLVNMLNKYKENEDIQAVLEFTVKALNDKKMIEAVKKMKDADFNRINILLDAYPIN